MLRRLRGVPDADAPADPAPAERAAIVHELLRAWMRPARPPRPLRFEGSEALRANGYEGALFASLPPPYLRAHSEVQGATVAETLARFDRVRRARLRPGEPLGERARYAWSRAYGALGEQARTASRGRAARSAHGRGARAHARGAHTNLGVALEATGDAAAAEGAYRARDRARSVAARALGQPRAPDSPGRGPCGT